MNHEHGHGGHPGGGPRPARFHEVELRAMDSGEVDALLRTAPSGRLGTVGPDGPYVVPLAFAWREGRLYFHCHTAGKKLDNISRDPRVCFQVDEHSPDTLTYRSVIVSGKAMQVEGEEAVAAMGLLIEKYSSSKKAPPASAMGRAVRVFVVSDPIVTSKQSQQRGQEPS